MEDPDPKILDDIERDEVGTKARAEMERVRKTIESVSLEKLAKVPAHAITLQVRKEFAAVTDWKKNDADPLGDGDQSLFDANWPGTPGFSAVMAWSNPAELSALTSPFSSTSQKLALVSQFMLSCAYGNVAAVNAQIAAAESAEARHDMLNRRGLALRMSPLMFCIMGARLLGGPEMPSERGMDHVKTADMLIKAGASVQARDVCGYSCLHHATTSCYSATSLTIAQLLIKAGASVNMHSRAGKSPLQEAIMNNALPPLALLLEAGADPTKYVSPRDMPPSRVSKKTLSMAAMVDMSPVTLAKKSLSVAYSIIDMTQKRKRVGAGRTMEGETIHVVDDHLPVTHKMQGWAVVCGPFDPYKRMYTLVPESAAQAQALDITGAVAVPASWVLPIGKAAVAPDADGVPRLVEMCNGCGTLARSRCSCGQVRYCGASCQRNHWFIHKSTCTHVKPKK